MTGCRPITAHLGHHEVRQLGAGQGAVVHLEVDRDRVLLLLLGIPGDRIHELCKIIIILVTVQLLSDVV